MNSCPLLICHQSRFHPIFRCFFWRDLNNIFEFLFDKQSKGCRLWWHDFIHRRAGSTCRASYLQGCCRHSHCRNVLGLGWPLCHGSAPWRGLQPSDHSSTINLSSRCVCVHECVCACVLPCMSVHTVGFSVVCISTMFIVTQERWTQDWGKITAILGDSSRPSSAQSCWQLHWRSSTLSWLKYAIYPSRLNRADASFLCCSSAEIVIHQSTSCCEHICFFL